MSKKLVQLGRKSPQRRGPPFATTSEERAPLTRQEPAPAPLGTMPDDAGWKKWGALVVFAVQNAGAVLLLPHRQVISLEPQFRLFNVRYWGT